jgi:hypothetical protein
VPYGELPESNDLREIFEGDLRQISEKYGGKKEIEGDTERNKF